MSAAHQVRGAQYPAVQVLLPHVQLVQLARGRGRAIQGDVASLGAEHHLVATQQPVADQVLQHAADDALRPLAAIVDRGVDDVDAGAEGSAQRVRVHSVRGIIAIAQIGAERQGRHL